MPHRCCDSFSGDRAVGSGRLHERQHRQRDEYRPDPRPAGHRSYPNLNIPPQVAAKQLTPEETQAKLALLKGEQQAQAGKGGGGVPSTSPAALNSLAKNHGKDTLKQIEAKCDPALDPTCK